MWKCIAQCSRSGAENRAGGWTLSRRHARDNGGTKESMVDSVLCWGAEVSTKSPLKISGTRGVATGRGDGLGKDDLEMCVWGG